MSAVIFVFCILIYAKLDRIEKQLSASRETKADP